MSMFSLCCHVQDVASFVKASDVTLPDPKAVCVVKLLLAFAVEICRMCRMYVSSAKVQDEARFLPGLSLVAKSEVLCGSLCCFRCSCLCFCQ